jgi:hypothetical protein
MSRVSSTDRGKRNKVGIPLRKVKIMGKTGLSKVKDWIRKERKQ